MRYADEINPFLGGDSRIRSLNRARIVALPGLAVAPGILGKTGYELVSAQALRQEVVHNAAKLKLDGAAPDLLWGFETCFDDPDTQPLARQLAHDYGQKLGFLLLMLKRGDPENRAARPEWGPEHWQFWRQISTIIVGGGMLAGQLGTYALPAAGVVLSQYGFAGITLIRSPYAAHLPLVGLARLAPLQTPAMLVLDFGHTSIKRAVARYEQDRVIALHLLPPLPTVCEVINTTERSFEAVQARWQRMLTLIEETWRQVAPLEGEILNLGISLACYLFEGHPSPNDWGCYGSLQELGPNLERFMQEQIKRQLSVELQLHLAHDGTAAALAHAGQPQSVVLTFGTAIGNGFPPLTEGYRPLVPEFQVKDSSSLQEKR